MEFDDILITVGEMGRVQVLLYILLGIVGFPAGMQNLAMVFLGASMDIWCDIPQLRGLSPKQIKEISSVSLPDGSLTSCEVYDLDYSSYSNETLAAWNRSLMITNSTTTRSCNSWGYDTSEFESTVRSQWGLVCDEGYIVALMQTIYMCGFLAGTITFGVISDRIGRLKTMMLCCLLMVLLASIAAIISVYWHFIPFAIIRFFVGMTTAGFFTTTFVLVIEIIAPKWRTHTGIFFQGFFAGGFCILPGVAYAVPNMLKIQLCSSLPFILLLSYYWFIPESPRWLIQKGRYEEAEKILRTIARLNKRPLEDTFTVRSVASQKSGKPDELHTGSLLDVMTHPRMRMRFFIAAYCWFVSGLTYYGLSYSAEALGGDIFINTLVSGLVEYPAYIICFFIVGHPKIGRKFSMSGSFFVGAVSMLICIGLLNKTELHVALLVMANIGKLGISAAFAIVYIFTAEIFPTVVRSACVGTSSMMARLGALLAPQIMLLWEYWYGAPYIIFGGLALIAGILSLLLPESVGQVLPETIDDGEMFGSKAYKEKHHLHPGKGIHNPEDEPGEPEGFNLLSANEKC